MKHFFSRGLFLIILITFLGFGLRVYKLTESPGGLYIDETSIGLNAYSIVTTGRDEHGVKFPLFFEAFGEYKLPLYIYLVALFQFFLGPIDLTIRLPSLIFGTLIIPTFYLLLKELMVTEKNLNLKTLVPILGAFMLSVAPWHYFFSRPGFEGGVGLFFVVLGLWLFFISVRVRSLVWLITGYLSFGFALYTYNSARIVVPISMIVLLIMYFRQFRFLNWLIAFSIFIIFTIPFWQFSFSSQGEMRAKQISILYQPKETIPFQFTKNYIALLSPKLWFVFGSPIIDNATKHRMPLLYTFDALFVLFGLILILVQKRRELVFMLFFLLIGLTPSAITIDSPHSLRAIFSLPAFIALAAYGISWVLILVKNKSVRLMIAGSYIFIILISLVNFLTIFHGPYVRDAARDWQVNYRIIGETVAKLAPKYDKIYFADGFNLTPLWWYLHINPSDLKQSRNRLGVGKYQFGKLITEVIPRVGRTLFVGSESPVNADFISHIKMSNGDKITSLWELLVD